MNYISLIHKRVFVRKDNLLDIGASTLEWVLFLVWRACRQSVVEVHKGGKSSFKGYNAL